MANLPSNMAVDTDVVATGVRPPMVHWSLLREPPQEQTMPSDNLSRNDGGVIRKLIGAGAEIAGAAVGGALGFLAAGPEGAAAGGAAGAVASSVLKHVGDEISERVLSPRERMRVGGVLALVASEVKSRIDSGQVPRSDEFFTAGAGGRSDADEVAEAVLLRSQREAEEKKLPYVAHLFASIAFDSNISAAMAHQLIKASEQLTYRQLCLLRLSAVKDSFGLRKGDYRGQTQFEISLLQVLYECLDLYTRGFVNFGGSVAFGPTDVNPGQMTPQGLGAHLYNAMQLSTIPMTEIVAVAHALK